MIVFYWFMIAMMALAFGHAMAEKRYWFAVFFMACAIGMVVVGVPNE